MSTVTSYPMIRERSYMKKFYQIKKYIIKIIYAVKDFNYYHAGSIIGSFPISAYPPSYYILSEEEKKIFQQDVERQKEELLEYIKKFININQGEIPNSGNFPLHNFTYFHLSRREYFSPKNLPLVSLTDY